MGSPNPASPFRPVLLSLKKRNRLLLGWVTKLFLAFLTPSGEAGCNSHAPQPNGLETDEGPEIRMESELLDAVF